MLWAWELKEFKLSRELSLLCTLPPPLPSACAPLRWGGSSRSEYQLSPNPLSLMLLSLRQGDSCRAFCADTNRHTLTLGCQIQHSHFYIQAHAYTCEGGCAHGWVCLCVFTGGVKISCHILYTHTTLSNKNKCMLQLIWKDAMVFYSLQSLSKQTPTCPVYPDDYVYGTETMRLHVNP